MNNEKPIEPPTGNMKRKHGTQWICRKCDDTYTTPQPVQGVMCGTCSHRIGNNQVWMHPANE